MKQYSIQEAIALNVLMQEEKSELKKRTKK